MSSKKYTPEFKEQAVLLYKKSNTSYAAVAHDLGIDPGSLSDWVKRYDNKNDDPSQNPFQLAEEYKALKKENARLKQENEILLKASAFFATKVM